MSWCTIESDPGVMTELMAKLGVKGVQAEELWDLSPEGMMQIAPVHGLIFLFKWVEGSSRKAPEIVVPDLFFAQQVIQNACATQALLNILLNCEGLELGEELSQFKSFTQGAGLDPETCGMTIGNSDTIRTVHNSFARQQVFSVAQKGGKDDDAFHFVGYVPFRGKLYELDGLQAAPIDHGAIPEGTEWTAKATEIIQARIAEYSASEIKFNLCALVKNRKDVYAEQLTAMPEGSEEALMLKDRMAQEDEKMATYSKENTRRRHNYIPLVLELLKAMAKSGKLEAATDAAKLKYQERVKDHLKQKGFK